MIAEEPVELNPSLGPCEHSLRRSLVAQWLELRSNTSGSPNIGRRISGVNLGVLVSSSRPRDTAGDY